MPVLANNEELHINGGDYTFKASGSLDLQVRLSDDDTFGTLTDGVFSGATTGEFTLAECDIKVINAGAETLTIKQILRAPFY